MILLDTNILSELMRPAPEAAVEQWLAAQPDSSVFICASTEAELRYGAALLPTGKRRAALTSKIEAMLEEDFDGRILLFDGLAAQAFAVLASERRQPSKPIPQADAQIVAIARSRGASLATRNVSNFGACGFEVINPWQVGQHLR